MNPFEDYRNSTIELVVNEYVHSERGRAILKRRLIDGIAFDQLAEEFDRTPRQMQRTVDKLTKQILKYFP